MQTIFASVFVFYVLIDLIDGMRNSHTMFICDIRVDVIESLAHANQLPFPRLQSASGHESDSCKQCYSKYLTFTFTSNRWIESQCPRCHVAIQKPKTFQFAIISRESNCM